MASETRDVQDFNEIELKGFGNLYLTQGDTESLRLEGDEDTLEHVTTEVRDGRLVIDYKRKLIISLGNRKLDIYVTFKDLRRARLSGSGVIRSESIQSFDMALELSGSGKLQVDKLTALRLDLHISGAGDATLGGVVESQHVRISGSGKCDAARLSCDAAEVDISGSGSIYLRAEKTLRVRVSGSGKIEYVGNPTIEQRISGSGKITRRAA